MIQIEEYPVGGTKIEIEPDGIMECTPNLNMQPVLIFYRMAKFLELPSCLVTSKQGMGDDYFTRIRLFQCEFASGR
jgi:hypothetical protein